MRTKNLPANALALTVLALLLGSPNFALATSSALAGIPAGSIVHAASFSINVTESQGATVNVHRVNAPWDESLVTWNSFAGAYDPAVLDTFPGNLGWQSADLTGLVQAWVDGTQPNYGIMIEQGQVQATVYRSSEDPLVSLRPMLDILYTPPGGSMQELLIQRAGAAPDTVADAYIWEYQPDLSHNYPYLVTGLVGDTEKQSLLRFDFTVDSPSPGTGTPGYWKNHPEAWPVGSIVIGGITYTKAAAIARMNTPDAGDKTYTMFRHLVAAKLNVLIGNQSGCIDATITAANAWMAAHPVGSHVAGSSAAWAAGSPLASMLDAYNNGLLCAPHRS